MPQFAKVDLELDATKSLNKIERQLRALANRPITLNIRTNNIGGIGGGGNRGSSSGGGGARSSAKSTLPLQNVNQFTKSLDAANARVLAFGASAGAIFAVTAAFKSLLSVTIDVDKALVGLNTILNLNDKSLASFSDSLFSIAKNTGQAFDAISEGASELARQGLGAEDTLARLSDAAVLSRLSGLSLADSVNSITTALNSFDKAGLSSADVLNKIVSVDQAFAVSSKDLADGLQRVGSSAQDAGVSFDQLLALLTTARQITGRTGSVIGNSFKTIFTRLQRSQVTDALADVGVSDTNSSGGLKTQIELLTDLAKVYDTLTPKVKANIAEQVGGVFQINVLKATLGDLGKEYGIYTAALDKSKNSSDEAIKKNEALNKSFSAQFNALTQSITQFSAKAGKDLFGGTFSNILGGGNALIGGLNKAFTDVEQGGATVGEKFAVGFVKGLGNFIGGPALLGVVAIVTKIFFKLAKDSASAILTLLNPALTQTNQLLFQQQKILGSIGATQKGIGGLGVQGVGSKGVSTGKVAGGLAGAGIGLNIAGGIVGNDTKAGASLNAAGNIAGLAGTGAVLGGPVGAAAGALVGLAISAKDLIDAFSGVEAAAKKSNEDAAKFSTDVASPIQDLTSRLLQNSSLVTDLSKSTNPADADALIKAQTEQISLLDQLNKLTEQFGKTFDTTNINVNDFGKLLEQISQKGTSKNLAANLANLQKGGLNGAEGLDFSKAIFDSIRSNLLKNPDLLNSLANNPGVANNDVLAKAGVDPKILSELSDPKNAEALSLFRSGIFLSAYNLRELSETTKKTNKAISENDKKAAQERQAATNNLKIYNNNLVKVSKELIDIQTKTFGNVKLKNQSISAATDLSSAGNSGLQKLLEVLGQSTSANTLQNKNAQNDIQNGLSSQSSSNLLDRNQGIVNAFQSVFDQALKKNFENANKEGANSQDSNQLLSRLKLSSDSIIKFVSELNKDDSQDSVLAAIEQVGTLLTAEGVDQKEIKGILSGLRETAAQGFAEFSQGQKELIQKSANDVLLQGLQTAIDQLTSSVDKQLSLFGGFSSFLDPSVNTQKLQNIRAATLANQAANTPQRIGLNNGGSSTQLPIDQTQAARTFANLADLVNNFFGPGRKIGTNNDSVSKAIEESKKTDFDNLIKSLIGSNASKNFFNSTRPSDFKGNLGDLANNATPELRQLINNAQTAFQSDLKNGKLGENVQSQALTDATFSTVIESQTNSLIKAYQDAAAQIASAVSSGSAAQPVEINVTVQGVSNTADVEAAVNKAVEPIRAAIKSGNVNKLYTPPRRPGTINGVPASQANSNSIPLSQ